MVLSQSPWAEGSRVLWENLKALGQWLSNCGSLGIPGGAPGGSLGVREWLGRAAFRPSSKRISIYLYLFDFLGSSGQRVLLSTWGGRNMHLGWAVLLPAGK